MRVTLIVCSCMHARYPSQDPQTCVPALTTLMATIYLQSTNHSDHQSNLEFISPCSSTCMCHPESVISHRSVTQQKTQTCVPVLQVAAAVFVFRGTVLTKRSNFAADLDVWRNANRDLYFAARAVKHLRLEMAQLQRQYPGVQWGFFCTGVCHVFGYWNFPMAPPWNFFLCK